MDPPSPELHRSTPTPFLVKTYQLVDDPTVDDLVSWNEDGTAFVVWRPAEFARDLLPKYFKHNNYSSFVRQLNTYGFKKVSTDRWEFGHDCFLRDEKQLLREIQRRRLSSATSVKAAIPISAVRATSSQGNSGEEQVFSSNSSPMTATVVYNTEAEIIEENERLTKENAALRSELDRLKSLCSNVANLMASFAADESEKAVEPMKCMVNSGGVTAEGFGPRLFGVTIGVKRVSRDDPVEESDEGGCYQVRKRGSDIKSEPLVGESLEFDGAILDQKNIK